MLHTSDFADAFMDWEKAKQEGVYDLVEAASKLWALGVPASLMVPVIRAVEEDLNRMEDQAEEVM
jgi:hypothetical protein